jgi:signal transduction histidine kinase/DNA-binding response OmpR family regulator
MAAPMTATPCAAAAPPTADEPVNILVVDDLAEKLLVFRTVLEDLEQNLVFVRSGGEALREVLRREFAVILLDVNMPDIDGLETAALIRRHRKSAHTPIIFITAYADEMQTAKGYALGAVDYILSPVNPDVLRSKVKVFVDLHTMQRTLRRQADERVALAAAEVARRVAEDNDRRSAFLAHASRVLGGSLDVDVGLRHLLGLVVPRIASFAAAGLIDDGGSTPARLLAMRTASHEGEPGADETAPEALPAPLREALAAALAERRRVDDAADAEHAVALPLALGDGVLGVLVVADAVPRHEWQQLDELAARAAIALENARLYRSLQSEIGERRTAQDELQDANRRKDEFLAMLSHELRNPLAPIRNAVEVIRRLAPPDPKFAWAGDVMDRQVQHLARLVDELLDVARISQGKIALNREPVELGAVVAQSVETAQPFFEARRQQLRLRLPDGPVWLQGDSARLAQIVANLLHNAAKYSEDGGTIELQLALQPGEAQISVRDHGIGIDAELLPRIFDLFTQGARSLDRSQGGLGVGLTLVRRLVELHGGRVEAHSEGLGKGAEFRFAIPRIAAVPEADAALAVDPAPSGGSRVLIVDDNRDAAESVALFLQLEGHEVKAVGDGLQALACVPVFAPQVVVLDIGLPQLDGYAVAQRLREMPAGRDVLLIAMTGYGQKEDRARAHAAGFDHHFVKPTDPRALVQLIAQWQAGRHAAPARSLAAR